MTSTSKQIDTEGARKFRSLLRHDEGVQLPANVRRMIEERADALGFPTLKQAAMAMSDGYREGRPTAAARLSSAERVAAYMVTRMPATYAAAHMVLGELRGQPISTALDLGAGTGAASLAVRDYFPEAAITMLERDAAFANAAREWLPDATVVTDDATRAPLPAHDLVIAAYSFGEFGRPVLQRLWNAAKVALVVIEPGTPAGFARIRRLRDDVQALGAHLAAPCPASGACPMEADNWCHFAARVERSSLHRRVKGGELGYEDEKFSYVIFTREPVTLPAARVVRHPQHRPGFIVLETCTPGGLITERIGKRDKETFRAARRIAWGDRWERSTAPPPETPASSLPDDGEPSSR